MKSTLVSLVTWCLLVGVLDASYNVFLPRSTHRYDYGMMVTTSTSSGDPQYAAVALKIRVRVDTPTEDKAVIKFEDIRVAKVNDELRKTELEDSKLEFRQSPEYSRNLSRPFEVKFKNGQIEKISFSHEDGLPSREMKKAFAQTLQLDLEGRSSRNALHRDSDKKSSFYRVMEPSLSGICETQYILKSLKDPACPECKVLNVTKIRDYRNCEEKVHFVHSNHPVYKCSDCESDASHPISKNTIITLNLKLKDGNYLLQNASSIGIVKISPLGEDSDQYIAVFNKTIGLVSVQPLSSPIDVRADKQETLLSTMTERVEKEILEPHRKAPIRMPFKAEMCDNQKIIANIKEVADTIEKDESRKQWRNALSVVPILVKAMRTCDYNDLESIMNHVTSGSSRPSSYRSSQRSYHSSTQRRYSSDEEDSQQNDESYEKDDSPRDAKRTLFLDLLAQCGTFPALNLWKKLTLKNDISTERSIKFIQVFATHCVFPRPQILETIKEVIKSDVVRQHEQLFSTIVMSYGTLVSRTCLRYKPYWNQVVEPEVLCPEPKRFLQPLVQLLEEVQSPQKKMALVNAIGETRLRDAVMPLKKYATGDAEDCDILQTEAVIALGKCAKLHPSLAKDILYSIFYDVEEAPKVRIAALVSLFKTNLNRHALEKIAMFTWEEPDTTVGTFVIKSLEAIANSSHPCFADLTSHAEHALNLIDDTFDDGLPLVHNVFFEQELPEFDITSLLTALYVSDGHPLAPKIMHAHYRPHVAGYPADLLRFSFFAQGTKSLFDQLVGPVAAFSDMDVSEILRTVDRPNRNVGLTDLAEKLGIKPREDDETKGVLKIALFGSQQRMFFYNKEKLAKLASSYGKGSDIMSKLQRGYEFDYQRTIMPLDINIITPTPVGLPLVFRVKSPVHFGLKGHIKVNVEGSLSNPQGLKVDLKLKPILAAKLIPSFGVKIPQEKILVGATYNTMVIIKPRIEGEFKAHKDNNQLTLTLKSTMPQKEHTVVYFSTRPMTFLHKYDSFTPIFQKALPITFLDEPKEDEYHLGPRKSSPFVVKIKHDTFWHNRGSIYDWIQRIADPSALPLAFLTQSWKNRAYEVVVDPTSINSKVHEVELKMNWKCNAAESQPQKRLVRGVKGLLTYLLGWASTQEKCTSSSSSSSSSRKPWEMRYTKEFRPYAAKSFMYDNRRDSQSEEDDSREDIWSYKNKGKSARRQYRASSEEDSSEEETYSSWNLRYPSHNMDRMEYSQKHSSMYSDDHDVRNYGDAEVRITDSYKGESRLEIDAELTARGSESHKIQAKLVLKKQHDAPIRTVDLVVNLPGREIQQVCLKARRQHARRPCYYGGELPNYLEKEIRSDIQVQWGRDCNSASGHLDVKIVANKSRSQLKYDPMPPTEDVKPWFYAQCQRDLAKGIPYSDECIMSLDHLAQLNQVTIIAKYDKVPAVVRNITHHIKLAAVAWLYPYMSYNPVDISHPEKTIKAVLNYHYDMPAVDINVWTPYAKAIFAKLPYTEISEFLQPPNVRKSLWKKVADSLTDDGPMATAFVSGNTINTYDNQTYQYKHWGQCKHVLVMDCTASNMFAVLNKPVGPRNKTLIVRILKHKIEIDATKAGSDREIQINGVPQKLSTEQRAFVYDKKFNLVVAYINKNGPHRYRVTLPQVGLRVLYDGYTTATELSQIWQDKVCGVFGDFDNDFIYEFRGPKQCAFTEGAEMAKAYAVRDGSCSPPTVSHQKVCDIDEYRSREDRSRTSGFSHSEGLSHNSGCTHKKTIKIEQGNKVCVSKHPVTECSHGCRPHDETEESIPFTCMDRDESRTERIMRDISAHRPVYGLSDRSTTFRKNIRVPERCSP